MTTPEDSSPERVQAPRRRKRQPREARMEVGAIVGDTFSYWFKNFIPFTALATVVFVPLMIYGLWLVNGGVLVNVEATTLVFALLSQLLGLALSATITYTVFQQLRGDEPTIGAAVSWGIKAVPTAFGTGILVGLCTIPAVLLGLVGVGIGGPIAFLFFLGAIVLGVWIVSGLVISVPTAVIEREGPFGAIKRSWHLSKGIRIQIILVLIVLGIISALAQIPLHIVFAALVPEEHVFWIEILVAILLGPVSALPPVLMYFAARKSKEGIRTDELASVFD